MCVARVPELIYSPPRLVSFICSASGRVAASLFHCVSIPSLEERFTRAAAPGEAHTLCATS